MPTSMSSTAMAPASGSVPDRRPRWRRLAGPLQVAGVVGLATLALHLRDPHSDGSWGKCPSLYFFGIACPLCGGLRAVNDLTNGHIVDAFWSNALFVSTLPLFALWWVATVSDRWRGVARSWTWPMERSWVVYATYGLLLGFSVMRNTPWGARFYP